MKRKISKLNTIAVVITIFCFVVIVLGGGYGYIELSGRLRVLENQTQVSSVSDMDSVVNFLKDQVQMIIWFLGVAVAGVGAVLTFFEITTRKTVEEKYEAKYLKLLAGKDVEVYKKKIVFVLKNDDEILHNFRRELKNHDYNTEHYSISKWNIDEWLRDSFIVVYRFYENDERYKEVVTQCEKKEIHCILYTGSFRIDPNYLKEDFSFMSISNQIAKLRESLYTLLYLAP